MAKRGRKNGSANQVVAHLFGAENMDHIASFKGTTQKRVRTQLDTYLNGYGMVGDKFLLLWGLGELISIVPSTAEVKDTATYTEDFFATDFTEPYEGEEE